MVDYRSAVGPERQYDLIGAQQFYCCVEQGLQEHHELIDVGCGSLRGGRFFIVYLEAGNYFGIEPNEELVKAGLKHEVGLDMLERKRPTFAYNERFEPEGVRLADFALAQSIFSHASPAQVERCLTAMARHLRPNGTFLMTYFQGERNNTRERWSARGSVRYRADWMSWVAWDHGFSYRELDFEHPHGQVWVRMDRCSKD